MTYEDILAKLEAYRYEMAGERRLQRIGRKPKPEFSAVQAKYADLFSKEVIGSMRDLIDAVPTPKERERRERTLFALVEGFLATRTNPPDEQLLDERAKMSAEGINERVGYRDFEARLEREDDFQARETLRASQVKLVERLNVLHVDRERAFRHDLQVFGFNNPREFAEARKRLKHEDLLDKTVPILEETTGLYRRVMGDVIRKHYGAELGDIGAVHALHWTSGREFRHLFPLDAQVASVKNAFAVVGLDFALTPGLLLDADPFVNKDPRPACIPARVPDEVHLIVRPAPGREEVRMLLEQGGKATHAAHCDPAQPYEWRQLPYSDALPETFGILFGQLLHDPIWLEHVLRIPKAAAERAAATALLADLFFLRSTIARFTYELAYDDEPFDAARNKALFADTMRTLTGFRHEPEWYLEMREPLFGAADRIRAWIASAQLKEHQIRTFGDRWFLRRETGAFLKTLFAKGLAWDAEELVVSLGMTQWDALPLIRQYDGVSKLLR